MTCLKITFFNFTYLIETVIGSFVANKPCSFNYNVVFFYYSGSNFADPDRVIIIHCCPFLSVNRRCVISTTISPSVLDVLIENNNNGKNTDSPACFDNIP